MTHDIDDLIRQRTGHAPPPEPPPPPAPREVTDEDVAARFERAIAAEDRARRLTAATAPPSTSRPRRPIPGPPSIDAAIRAGVLSGTTASGAPSGEPARPAPLPTGGDAPTTPETGERWLREQIRQARRGSEQ